MPIAIPRDSSTAELPQNLPRPGQAALLRACTCPSDQFAEHWRVWRALEDIEHLDESSNRLVPLLFRQAERAGLIDAEMGRLRGIYRYQWCRNQLMLSELRRVIAVLQQASIEVILLKGAALIQQYYGDPGLRPMSDLDIMVRPDKFEEAGKILRGLGYAKRVDLNFEKIRFGRLTHAIEFTRSANGKNTEIDLHWTPLHRATWPGAEECFWKYSVPVDFKGVECRTFDATHQLLHVCLHGALWNALPPFRWVTDAMWILRKDAIDWHRLVEDANRLNGLQLLQSALNYIFENHDAPIPKSVMKKINGIVPSRFETLEFRLQTISSRAMRVDQLLLLGWMNHSRAFPGVPWWRLIRSFPSYLKAAIKITHWRKAPGYMIRRMLQRE
jgi:hypothetical protein